MEGSSILKIHNKLNNSNLRIFITEEVSSRESLLIQKAAKLIFDEYRGKKNSVISKSDLLNLCNKISQSDAEQVDSPFICTINKIQQIAPKSRRIIKTRKDIYKKLTKSNKNFLIKFIWMVFIAPFITVYRFRTQNKKIKSRLDKVFNTPSKTQAHFVSRLKSTKKMLDGSKDSKVLSDNFASIISIGEKIKVLQRSSNVNTTPLAKEITQKFVSRANNNEEFIGAIPCTIPIANTNCPLLFMFRKKDNDILLEIEGLPADSPDFPKEEKLQATYLIKSENFEASCRTITESLLSCVKKPAETINPLKLTRRQKIRIKNLDLTGAYPYTQPVDIPTQNPVNNLRQVLTGFAEAQIDSNRKSGGSSDLPEEMLYTLMKCYPEASKSDKVEWVLASIEEEYTALFEVKDKLSIQDKKYFFTHLENKMTLFERSLSKDVKAGGLFKSFYDKLESFKKEQKSVIQKLHYKSQSDALTEKISVKRPYKIKIPSPVIESNKKSVAKIINKTVGIELYADKLSALKNAFTKDTEYTEKDRNQILTLFKEFHTINNALIEKKSYVEARALALAVLASCPCPSPINDQINFWTPLRGSASCEMVIHGKPAGYSEEMVQQISGLLKDIWETSLRLNETSPDPDTIIQLIKALAISSYISFSSDSYLDYTEIESIVHIHPHIRFGWKPEQFKELQQLMNYVKTMKNNSPLRKDFTIKNRSRGTLEKSEECARMEMMFSSLMKPHTCFSVFYGSGITQQLQGMSWLDGLKNKAVALGAKTESEIKEQVRFLILDSVQQKLKGIKRLEIGSGIFVTEHYCLTVVDAKSPKKNILAYVPTGFGLPPVYEKKYGLDTNEKNTEAFAGGRGAGKFIGPRDNSNIANKSDHNYSISGLPDALSPQIANTEPSLLAINLQTAPKGQINQIESYLLESAQIINDSEVDPSSVSEIFNVIFQERNLGDPELQKTVQLLLSRSFLLTKELLSSPKELLEIVLELKKLTVRKSGDPNVFPFLIQIGEMIKGFAEATPNDPDGYIKQIIKDIPSFDNRLKINGKMQTGRERLEEMLKNKDMDHPGPSIAYVYCMHGRPLDKINEESMAIFLYAYSLFNAVGDSRAVSQFNKTIRKEFSTTLSSEIARRGAEKPKLLDSLMNHFLTFMLPPEKLSEKSSWNIHSKNSFEVENSTITVNLKNIQLISKETKKPLMSHMIEIPAHIRNQSEFLDLFGRKSIKAQFQMMSQNISTYTFTYGKKNTLYRITYDEAKRAGNIQGQFLTNPLKKKNAMNWFTYRKEGLEKGDTTVELMIKEKGLWINTKTQRKGYLITSSPETYKKSDMLSVVLDRRKVITKITNLKGDLSVANLTPEETRAKVPFANGFHTLLFLDSQKKIGEIAQTNLKTTFSKEKNNKWKSTAPYLNQGTHWLPDISEKAAGAAGSCTHEAHFFEKSGSDTNRFLIPFSEENGYKFHLLPYEIQYTSSGLDFSESSIGLTDLQHVTLNVSFGEEGEMQGSPSSYLYLSYYFCMKKDYERALFYLKKAKKPAALDENEQFIFEKIANYFNHIPFRSESALAFQLKAQLAIRSIREKQFSKTNYTRENEEKYLHTLIGITDLYQVYTQKFSQGKGSDFKLTDNEISALERIRWSSYKDWTDEQNKKTEKKNSLRSLSLPQNDNFLTMPIQKDLWKNKLSEWMTLCILLSKGENKKASLESLTVGVPTLSRIIGNFFSFYKEISLIRSDVKGNADVLKEKYLTLSSYLLKNPDWKETVPKTEDEKKFIEMGDNLRIFLLVLLGEAYAERLKQLRDLPEENTQCTDPYSDQYVFPVLNPYEFPVFNWKEIENARKKIPYIDRDNIVGIKKFLGMADGIIAQYISPMIVNNDMIPNVIQNILYPALALPEAINFLFGGCFTIDPLIEFLLETNPAIDSTKEITLSQLLPFFPESGQIENKKEETEGVTLQTISDYMTALPPDHSYLPIEISEIPQMISETDADLQKPYGILTLVREAEMRGWPLLQIRIHAENLREIEKLEREIALKQKHHQEFNSKLSSPEILTFASSLVKECESFAGITKKNEADQKASLEDLEIKYKTAEKYFNPENVASEPEKKEYREMLEGLKVAKETLGDEMKRKSTFSPAETANMKSFLNKHLSSEQKDSLTGLYQTKLKVFLNKIKDNPFSSSLKKMVEQPDLYTEFDLLREAQKLYKNPAYSTLYEKEDMDKLITEILLCKTGIQQFVKAAKLIEGKHDNERAAKALVFLKEGCSLGRYFKEDGIMFNSDISRKILVAEARSGIIYRPGQRTIIEAASNNPEQWFSLRMGLGKTSYAVPTIAEILAEKGKFVVITVPEKLLKSNRKDIDKSTRLLFDQAGLEFSLPLTKDLPINILSEKVKQLLEIFKKKGYVITTVDELATLHDTCILLEDERCKFFEQLNSNNKMGKNQSDLVFMELRLHYYKTLDRLLRGQGTNITLPGIFFGDETDETHHITHEVSIAIGEKTDPDKVVRAVSRIILETVMNCADRESPLFSLKESMLENTYPGMSKEKSTVAMKEIAKDLQRNKNFLQYLGTSAALIEKLDSEQWSDYLIGARDKFPDELIENNELVIKYISSAKQILSLTFSNFLSQNPGNDLGFSDHEGHIVMPKITKNETKGMRFGDEFEMIVAQYLGYLEFLPAQGTTNRSKEFLDNSLQTLKEKSYSIYELLMNDYQTYCSKHHLSGKDFSLYDFIRKPEAFMHRWNILDEVVFNGGYIQRFTEQVSTNVQEIFHKKPCGGVTGTLDPYPLPFISEDIQLNKAGSGTRDVEAETFLRIGLNLNAGLDTVATIYQDQEADATVKALLAKAQTTAFINSNGATSEGMNTLSWIEKIRKNSGEKIRNYLFMHPVERIPYFYGTTASKAVPYKGRALPADTICLYAPSDVRGVDLPIRKGDVHMFVSPTASPQELVQSLYRARQLGGDHQLILHISESLRNKIAEKSNKTAASNITYGDVLTYLINRSIDMKLELNLKAHLMKIQFDLKNTVTDFLKETNPELTKREWFTNESIKEGVISGFFDSKIFTIVRGLYIQLKQIDFSTIYEPQKFIKGTTKILEEYKELQKNIQEILEKLRNETDAFGVRIKRNQAQAVKLLPQLEQTKQTIEIKLSKSSGEEHQTYKKVQENIAKAIACILSRNLQHTYEALADIELALDKICSAQSDPDPIFADAQKLITELMFGKGKSNLYNSLRKVLESSKEEAEAFEQNKEAHKEYLPKLTTENRAGKAGSNEQVKEMQQQQVQNLEQTDEDTPPEVLAKHNRIYKPFDPTMFFYNNVSHPLGAQPFNDIDVSPEAKDILQTLNMLTGVPLLYVVVNHAFNPPKMSLIGKLDYQVLKNNLDTDLYKNISIYSPLPKGMRRVLCGRNREPGAKISEQENNVFLTIKAYLGYKEEFSKISNPKISRWSSSLSRSQKQGILDHIAIKGSSAQREVFSKLLG